MVKYIINTNIKGFNENAVINFNLNKFITHLVAPQLGQRILNFSFIKQLGTRFTNLELQIIYKINTTKLIIISIMISFFIL